MYEYRAVVRRVVDGDSIHADIDLGFKQWSHDEDLRLIGINAPDNENVVAKRAATAYLKGLLPVGTVVTITTIKDKTEKYGRMLALVYRTALDGSALCVNEALVADGHAVPWDGIGPRPTGE